MKNEKCKEDLNGIYGELAEIVGYENAAKIHKVFRGQQISMPLEFFSKEYRKNQIKKDFDGKNYKQLAQRFHCSERTIRRVVKENQNEQENAQS